MSQAGVPLRLEVGSHELSSNTVTVNVHPSLACEQVQCVLHQYSSKQRQDTVDQHGQQQHCQHSSSLQPYHQHCQPCNAIDQNVNTNDDGTTSTTVPLLTSRNNSQQGKHSPYQSGVKIRQVAIHLAPRLCNSILAAAAASASAESHSAASDAGQTVRSLLLPHGYCTKTHLWPQMPPTQRPCTMHLRYLLQLSKPCYCGRSHVSMTDLQQEITTQLQTQHNCQVLGWMHVSADTPLAPPVAVFISGLPVGHHVSSVQQALMHALSPYGAKQGNAAAYDARQFCDDCVALQGQQHAGLCPKLSAMRTHKSMDLHRSQYMMNCTAVSFIWC